MEASSGTGYRFTSAFGEHACQEAVQAPAVDFEPCSRKQRAEWLADQGKMDDVWGGSCKTVVARGPSAIKVHKIKESVAYVTAPVEAEELGDDYGHFMRAAELFHGLQRGQPGTSGLNGAFKARGPFIEI